LSARSFQELNDKNIIHKNAKHKDDKINNTTVDTESNLIESKLSLKESQEGDKTDTTLSNNNCNEKKKMRIFQKTIKVN